MINFQTKISPFIVKLIFVLIVTDYGRRAESSPANGSFAFRNHLIGSPSIFEINFRCIIEWWLVSNSFIRELTYKRPYLIFPSKRPCTKWPSIAATSKSVLRLYWTNLPYVTWSSSSIWPLVCINILSEVPKVENYLLHTPDSFIRLIKVFKMTKNLKINVTCLGQKKYFLRITKYVDTPYWPLKSTLYLSLTSSVTSEVSDAIILAGIGNEICGINSY